MGYGLLGQHLSHSYSPQIHSALADYKYDLFQIEPENLDFFIRNEPFNGINVTIPYKKAVLPYCSDLSAQAKRLGSVNTIVRKPDGSLWGHNTDYFGFQEMVHLSGIDVKSKKALVLGSGGAGVTATAVLQDLGAEVVTISRSGDNNYDNLYLHADAALIVNATPVGMYPNNGQSPIDLSIFPMIECVLDLIYNPSKTELLLQAEKMGIVALNGLYMLVAQAKQSAEYFSGHSISNDKILDIYKGLKLQMENIILIGMPGSGKTTIGAILAQNTGRQFMDTDALIEKRIGMPVSTFIKLNGIEAFRLEEIAVIKEVCKQSGLIISTGGGCVTREENYNPIRQNGIVVWLKRCIEDLPTKGRPLSENANLNDMYAARKPLYSRFADLQTENVGSPKETAERIVMALEEIK